MQRLSVPTSDQWPPPNQWPENQHLPVCSQSALMPCWLEALSEITWCSVYLKWKPHLTRLQITWLDFVGFNKKINTVRALRAILSPCFSLNLPRVSAGWRRSWFFCRVWLLTFHNKQLGGPEDQRSKSATVFSHVSGPIFLTPPHSASHNIASLQRPDTLHTESQCLCQYNKKSWHSEVPFTKCLSAQRWHKTLS